MVRLSLAIVVCGLLAWPAASQAAIRAGAVDDPRDVVASVTPPNMPDLQRVEVQYDEAGSVVVALTFWERIASPPGEYVQTFPMDWHATQVTVNAGVFHATVDVGGYASNGRVDGLEGKFFPSASSESADGRTLSMTFSNPNLANRDLRSVSTSLSTWVRGSASDLSSRYDTRTHSWYRYASNLSDSISDFWFAGYAPACSNQQDDDLDGWTDLDDPGCKGKATTTSEADRFPVRARFALKATTDGCEIDTEVTVLPDIKPAVRFPFKRVRLRVRGPGYDKARWVPLGQSDLYGFRVRRSGRYRVTGFYPGDDWRMRSATSRKIVKVRCR